VTISSFLDCCRNAAASGGAPEALAACTGDVQFTTRWSLSNATADTIGLTTFTLKSADHRDMNALLTKPCSERDPVTVGNLIALQNGSDFNQNDVRDFNTAYAGKPGTVIAIVQSAGCPNPTFNQQQPIVGFATATLSTATWFAGNVGGTTGNGFSFTAKLSCMRSVDPKAVAGGGFFGTVLPPTLVR
jgi:hypothetical protein